MAQAWNNILQVATSGEITALQVRLTGDETHIAANTAAIAAIPPPVTSLAWTAITGIPTSFTPSAHVLTHESGGSDPITALPYSIITGVPSLGTAAALNVPSSGNATSGQVVLGSDTRLVVATPTWAALTGTPPALSIFSGSLAYSTLSGVPSSFVPAAHSPTHAHGGSDPVSVTYSDLVSIPTTFTPSVHHSSHVTGGSDIVPLVTATATGLCPITPNDPSQVLYGNATWNMSTPIYQMVEIVDDFTAYQPNVTATTVLQGPNNWQLNIVGTASASYTSAGTDAFNKAVGVWYVQAAATTTAINSALMYLPTAYTILGLGQLDLFFRVAYFQNPSAGTYLRMGLVDSGTTFINEVAVIIENGPDWILQTVAASAATTTTATNVPALVPYSATAATFYKVQISINPLASTATGYVNGTLIGTSTTNIPTAKLVPFILMANPAATAAANLLYIDKFYYRYQISV
jgi:hypothetical protein